MCDIFIYTLQACRPFFRYPLGGYPSQGMYMIDHRTTQVLPVLNGPGAGQARHAFTALSVRQPWNYGTFLTLSVIITNDYPETPHKPPSNATKLCICCVGLLHCLNPPIITGSKHDPHLRRAVLLSRRGKVVCLCFLGC